MRYDTVLIDTKTIAHQLWHKYKSDIHDAKELCKGTYDVYSKAVFTPEAKSVIWVSDSKPYWRSAGYPEYKGTRRVKSQEQSDFLDLFVETVNPVVIPQYEADDLIATYVQNVSEQILMLTIDTDILQLIRYTVDWQCSHGHYPSVRTTRDGSFLHWMTAALKKKSSKRIGHLKPSDPKSLIEMKVEYGDPSDNIPRGESSRYLIDLYQLPSEWDIPTCHPDWLTQFEEKRIIVDRKSKSCPELLGDFMIDYSCIFPTSSNLFGSPRP